MSNEEVAISNPILGSLKVNGSNINNIFTVLGFIMISLIAWVLWQHHVQAADTDKASAASIKESNKQFVDALKESNVATVKALEKISEEQKKATEAQRETNCLLSLPQDRRTNAGEICKRIAR